jgi:hypothetical protein
MGGTVEKQRLTVGFWPIATSCLPFADVEYNSPMTSVSQTTSSRPFYTRPWFYALVCLFLLLAIFAARLVHDFDFGYHLKGGQWIVQNQVFPEKDTYTYTLSNHEYLDLHWLFQVGLFTLYLIGSYPLIVLATVGLVGLTFLITFLRLRHTGAPLWMSVILLGLALIASEIRFQPRPEIVSWVLMSVMLWVLEKRALGKESPLFLLPVILLFWVNMEGLFAIGWGLMALFLADGFVRNRKIDRKLLKYCLLAAAICFLNPYLWRGVLHPLELLSVLSASGGFKGMILELESPWTLNGRSPFVPVWTLAAYEFFSLFLLALLVATYKKRKGRDWALTGMFFYFSCTSLRNIPLFMIACVPLAASCWMDLKWAWLKRFQTSVFERPWAAWVTALFLLGLSLRVMTGAYYASERRIDRFGLGLDLEKQPVNAVKFLKENNLDGRLLNHLNCGGWLDWQAPQKTFIDGRLEVLGKEFFNEFNVSMNPGGLKPLADKYQADILFFNSEYAPLWLRQVNNQPDWRPVYLDEAAVIYLKDSCSPEVPRFDGTAVLTQRGISPNILQEFAAIIGLKSSSLRRWIGGFYLPSQYPSGLNSIGAYFFQTGQPVLAEMAYLECVKRTRGNDWLAFLHLGGFYLAGKRYEEARLCLERVQQDAPGFARSKRIMDALPK